MAKPEYPSRQYLFLFALVLAIGIVVDDAVRRDRLIARHIAFGKAPDAARAWALGPDERNAAAIAATLERADYLLSP